MILYILQIIAAVVMIGSILLQAQGGGLSPAFGGGGEMYRSRQSIEKILIILTALSAAVLAICSIALLVL